MGFSAVVHLLSMGKGEDFQDDGDGDEDAEIRWVFFLLGHEVAGYWFLSINSARESV